MPWAGAGALQWLGPTFCSCRMRLYNRCASSSASFLARFSCSRLVPRLHVLLRSPSTPTSAMVGRLVQPACKQPSAMLHAWAHVGAPAHNLAVRLSATVAKPVQYHDAGLLLAQSMREMWQ
jgi:hypothetical protein